MTRAEKCERCGSCAVFNPVHFRWVHTEAPHCYTPVVSAA